MAKMILFDLDGTLTDSGEGIMNCAEYALTHFGIPIPPRNQLRAFVGPPLHDSFVKFGVSAEKADEAVEVYRSRYTTLGKFENFPYPGIKELLGELRAEGNRLFVATSKPEKVSVEILEKFELAQYFERICGASLGRSRSEKAAVIAYLLESIGRSENMVMVGDSHLDILGAAAHAIPGIGVAWGYGDTEKMRAAGALCIVESVEELLAILRNK